MFRLLLRAWFLTFSRPVATFSPCFRLAGRKVINEDNLLRATAVYLKMLFTKLGLLLQTGSHFAYIPLIHFITSGILETAFAAVIYQYQVYLIMLRFSCIPPCLHQYEAS